MPALGNVWHLPGSPEPRGLGGMRAPVGPVVAGTPVRILTGNQFAGDGGNPGNQLQDGSELLVRASADPGWRRVPLQFERTAGNNKYYAATVPAGTFGTGTRVEYYLRIAYDDHDTTFVHAQGDGSATTADEAAARAAPFTYVVDDAAVRGAWEPVFALPNVAVHASVLPTGRVLMWGRRDTPGDSLDVHACTPFVWDPADGSVASTPQPRRPDGATVNLFCSGHAFLPDGRLLVVGGHLADGDGLSQTSIYDAATGTWTPGPPMTGPDGQEVRRWYPTATALPDGGVLVMSGSYRDPARPGGMTDLVADLLHVWADGAWRTVPGAGGTPLTFLNPPLYPRLHVAGGGRVFMSGPNDRTVLLRTAAPGAFSDVALRALGGRDYCPAALYDTDKVLYLGGGNDAVTAAPTAECEIIDLAENPPRWRRTGTMAFPRRQHNAVLLPDGTVLAVGGTRGGGGPNRGFNDLTPGAPVHAAELWDPRTGRWSLLAAESVDRCYHSVAVLLPDGRVLSAGGGEYRPGPGDAPNDPEDSHPDAQIFRPPYLFKGPRPEITSAPSSVGYGDAFDVGTPAPDDVRTVSWLRLPSVTHSFDENQRITFLAFEPAPGGLRVTAPATAAACPPGHYMMFLVNGAGVPSVASIVQVRVPAAPAAFADVARRRPELELGAPPGRVYLRIEAREARVAAEATGTRVVVGITGTCPYGIGSCWGGAYEALRRLEDVDLVAPVPDVEASTAQVFLADEGLPVLDTWLAQFPRIVNGTYELRGVEVSLRGPVLQEDGRYALAGAGPRPPVRLGPLEGVAKIQWDRAAGAPQPAAPEESGAYDRLVAAHRTGTAPRGAVTVTGPLTQDGGEYVLHVRQVEA